MSDDRIHPAASLGFEVAVEHYERGRPTYPELRGDEIAIPYRADVFWTWRR